MTYVITAAYVQCGEKPPYNCIGIPVRMLGKTPQIKLRGVWLDFPHDKEFRPKVDKFYSMSVAGIAADWRIES